MKSLVAPFLATSSSGNDISVISLQLDQLPAHTIDCFPWPAYKSKVSVCFSIAGSDKHVLLKFKVREKNIRAINTVINSPVYEDSCVEFFIAFDDIGYYNFEFNCIGTKLAEFGKSRELRKFLPLSAIEKIVTETFIKYIKDDFYIWELTVLIPVETFMHHQIVDIRSRQCRANFYKCGDKLLQPHYIVWSPIVTAEPDFHQPQYFGELAFSAGNNFSK